MVYLYDEALAEDLRESFTDSMGTSTVRVVDPDAAVDVVSQLKNDQFQFPAVVLTRNDYSIDNNLTNFTRMHRGVTSVFDKENNVFYDERSIPINLSYNVTILGTNTVDMDELTRELMFKYSDMYYLKIKLPYESDRSSRFGVVIDRDNGLEQSSRLLEYLEGGKVYQNVLHLNCQGCVLLSYKPRQLTQHELDSTIYLGKTKAKKQPSSGVYRSSK